MKVEIEINEKDFGLVCAKHEAAEVRRLLNELYQLIYMESSYDPYSKETEQYALRLLPAISSLNKILKFKT